MYPTDGGGPLSAPEERVTAYAYNISFRVRCCLRDNYFYLGEPPSLLTSSMKNLHEHKTQKIQHAHREPFFYASASSALFGTEVAVWSYALRTSSGLDIVERRS